MSENQNGLQSPIIICGEPEIDPARFPCISLGSIQADTMEELERNWRKQLKQLAGWIQKDTYKKLTVSERRILQNLGSPRAGVIPDTYWGLSAWVRAYKLQNSGNRYYIEGYDSPLLKAVQCGYGREASELIHTILSAAIGDMDTEVQVACRFPLESGKGFRYALRRYDQETIRPLDDEEMLGVLHTLCLDYMEEHFEETVECFMNLLQREYVKYAGDFWLADYEQGFQSITDLLTVMYYCGWLGQTMVDGQYYLKVQSEAGMQALKRMTAEFMDRISGMQNSTCWVQWVLSHKDNMRLRDMLEVLDLEDAEKILKLAILLSEGNYRVYSWKYVHRQQLYLLAVDADHQKEAYAIAAAKAPAGRDEYDINRSRSELYLNLRQRIRRLPAYKWVQGEKNLIELTLVLFTNE